jgi:hypothetical protein
VARYAGVGRDVRSSSFSTPSCPGWSHGAARGVYAEVDLQNRDKCSRTTDQRRATIGCVRLLAELLAFPLLSIGGFLVALDILVLLVPIVEGSHELQGTMAWWKPVIGLGIPAITMLAGGIFLTRKLPPQ